MIITNAVFVFQSYSGGFRSQNLGARGDIINKFWPRMEAVARDCDLAFILISHSTRSYDFQIYDGIPNKKKEGILDAPVTNLNAGVWGASSLMYNVKVFLQIENCTRDHCKKKNIKHFLRRLMPGTSSSHVDLEFIRDYGYVEF